MNQIVTVILFGLEFRNELYKKFTLLYIWFTWRPYFGAFSFQSLYKSLHPLYFRAAFGLKTALYTVLARIMSVRPPD